MDQLVVCGPQTLLRHQFFLIQLFAGTETGVFDLDIHVRLQSGEPDHIPCEGIDLYRAAHIQDEDLAAVSVGSCQHYQADGFGHCHEITNDVRVRDRYGAAAFDLAFENRDDGAVGTENIAEAYGDKLRFNAAEEFIRKLMAVVVTAAVHIKLGDLGGLAGLDLRVKALDDHFAKPLAGTHDIGGVDGLVRADQHKALTAVHHGGVGGFVCTDGVVLDGLAGAVLHQGDMLMGCGVIDDLRTVIVADLEDPAAVPHGTDQYDNVQIRVFILQLQLDVIGVVFINVKNDQTLRVMTGNLPAELRTDAAAAAGDHDGFSLDELKDLRQIGLDRITTKKVLNGDVFQGAGCELALHELVHTGEILDLAFRLVADGDDVAAVRHGGAGDRKKNLVHPVFFYILHDAVPSAHDPDVVHIATPFVGIVVNDADDFSVGAVLVQVPQDHLACGAGADQHDPIAAVADGGVEKEQQDPIGKADPQDESELEHGADHIVGDRHSPEEQERDDHVKRRGQERGDQSLDKLAEAGKAPDAAVQAKGGKKQNAKQAIDRSESGPNRDIGCRDQGIAKIIADQQRKKIGRVDHHRVIDDEQRGNDFPVFIFESFFQLFFRFHSRRPSVAYI